MRPAPGIAMASARTSARAAVAHHPVIAPKLIWRRAEVITVLICDSEAVSQAAVARCGEGFPGRRILNGRFTPRSKPSAEPCATSKEFSSMKRRLITLTTAALASVPMTASAQHYGYGPPPHHHEEVRRHHHGDHDHVEVRRHHHDDRDENRHGFERHDHREFED
jgi:hypothetical protein